MKYPTPYQRIVRAADKGVGVRLTWEECNALANDGAIQTVAWDDDEAEKDERAARRAARRRASEPSDVAGEER